MKHKDYWRKRFEQLEEAQNNKSVKYYLELEKQYKLAINSIEKDILAWYNRFAKNEGISLLEAKKLLNTRELEEFKWSVEEYIKYGKENAINQKWMKELENASARVHITRLEALKLQIQQQVEVLYGNELDGIDKLMRDIYTSGYYHTAFNVQQGVNVGWSLMSLDTNKINKVISKPWTSDGLNFSERIWGKHRPALINELHTKLTQSIIRGENPKKLVNDFAKRFNVSKSQAKNLIMTESAFFASASRKDCFNDLDVEKYEIVATLDLKTSNICRELDGKVFDMKDYQVGVTAPPFHCRCRTTTAPWFEDEEGYRAAKGKDGKTYYVPSSMKYNEWYEKYVKNNDISEIKNSAIIDSIKEDIKNGNYNLNIHDGKQGKHLKGHNNYIEGRSYLTITKEEAQELVNRHAGNGIIKFNRSGEWDKKELIEIDKNIGVNVNNITGEKTLTNKFKIHYSKTGTHIVPAL
ncbi:polymorphic toxin type 50 domain-containing protein [Clostridioides difficile]|nr:phage head morphogenesis protein [Clostridioides difficile]EGT4002144.1 phage head morphogenesis protein [Clostridioides difficile]MBH6909761.1 minor capsid protein [Clostridioides difficile]MBH7981844.1 minor capsid protein [Clostridioides difficile]MBH8030480.1 minor capsid protein [Clostridioides difficile]